MRLFTRTLHWTITLIFIGLLILLALTFFAPVWWGVDLRGVASGSMAPTVPVGAMVVIEPVEIEEILPGDIITFQSPEMMDTVVTHRVIEVSVMGGERAFRTQGDANEDPDLNLLPASKVLGRVMFDLPYLGYLSQFIRTRQGWFVIIIIPAAILILMEVVSILKLIWRADQKVSPNRKAKKRLVWK